MDKERLAAVEIGKNTMLADMTKCLIAELKVMPKSWQSMSSEEQDDVIDRMQKQLKVAAQQAINIIASRNMAEVTGMVEVLTFKDGAKATIKFNSINEGVHSLADAVGHYVKIIIPETEDLINEAGMPKGEADQRSLELGHEYDESEKGESYDGEPFITTASENTIEELVDALSEVENDNETEEEDNSLVVSTAESDLVEEETVNISTADPDDEADSAGDSD